MLFGQHRYLAGSILNTIVENNCIPLVLWVPSNASPQTSLSFKRHGVLFSLKIFVRKLKCYLIVWKVKRWIMRLLTNVVIWFGTEARIIPGRYQIFQIIIIGVGTKLVSDIDKSIGLPPNWKAYRNWTDFDGVALYYWFYRMNAVLSNRITVIWYSTMVPWVHQFFYAWVDLIFPTHTFGIKLTFTFNK